MNLVILENIVSVAKNAIVFKHRIALKMETIRHFASSKITQTVVVLATINAIIIIGCKVVTKSRTKYRKNLHVRA